MEGRELETGDVLNDNIKIIDKLSTGFFGTIYLASMNGKHVILKENTESDEDAIKREVEVYKALGGRKGYPKMHHVGRTPSGRIMIVLDRLGDSLENIRSSGNTAFHLNTLCMIGISVTYHLELLHGKGYIHGDLKPENILSGLRNTESEYELFLIDFGNSWKYRNNRKEKYAQRKVGPEVAGTLDFAPKSWHKRISQSRKDDFESLLYTLAYLQEGKLPWIGMPRRTPRDISRIGTVKEHLTCDDLFKGENKKIEPFFDIVWNMTFFERPKYHEIRQVFRKILKNNKIENENDFPWLD